MRPSQPERFQQLLSRSTVGDGVWWYGVSTTRVFCRPSCSSPAPLATNVQFFDTVESALQVGFRPCRRCKPLAEFDSHLYQAEVSSPLGPLVALGNQWGLALLEFADRRMLPTQHARTQHLFGAKIVGGDFPARGQIQRELDLYFQGALRRFTTPVMPLGTLFQQAVWQQLTRVAYGATTTYDAIARAIRRPAAVRAVGGANGDNRYAIVLPCHRVIGSDGRLTGYGGGLWRKEALLELEGARQSG